MKLIQIFFILFSFSAFSGSEKIFLVTSHHPHEFKQLSKYTKVVKNLGRTVLVIKKKNIKIPKEINKILKEVNLDEVSNYTPENLNNLKINPNITKLIKDINTTEMEEIVTKLSSFSNRRAGSSDNYNASLYIQNEMKKMGLITELDCFKIKTCNVYGKIQGSTYPDEVILVEAHLDSVGRVKAGADDNASGIAGLLLIAKKIVSINPKKSFIFFATNGEEKGLLGAKHYVKVLDKTGELRKVQFVINMDMIGYNKDNLKVDLETNKEFISEAQWMADVVNTYTKLVPNIVTPAWGSDHVPFLNKDIPTVLTIEHWPTKTPCYHASCDKPGHLTYEYGLEIIKLNIAAAYLKSEE